MFATLCTEAGMATSFCKPRVRRKRRIATSFRRKPPNPAGTEHQLQQIAYSPAAAASCPSKWWQLTERSAATLRGAGWVAAHISVARGQRG